MGFGTSIVERWDAFYSNTQNTDRTARLRMDEKRSDMGSFDSADYRNAWFSTKQEYARQSALLARLIGDDHRGCAAVTSQLLAAFGSIGGVLLADAAALARVIGDEAIVDRLTATRSAVMEGLSEQVRRIPFDLGAIGIQRWVVGLFKGVRRERIHFALLDRSCRVIFDGLLADGELARVSGSMRQIVGSGLGMAASGVVLMHNHPSGDVEPSVADVEETRRIADVLMNLDMPLVDHLIVSDNAIFSMKGAGLL